MRIRRSAELSPAAATANGTCPEELLQAHVCRLNQSPWDVAIIAQSSPNAQQEGGDGEDNGSSQRGDSVAAVERVYVSSQDIALYKFVEGGSFTSSMMGASAEMTIAPVKRRRGRKKKKKKKKTPDQTVESDNDDDETGAVKKSKNKSLKRSKPGNSNGAPCQKNDGKGWQCKREAKHGCNFCEHHLSLFRSYNAGTGTATPEAAAELKSSGMTRRTRGVPKRPSTLTANPYEFYYYSGFGPRWRKRRRGGRGTSPETVASSGDNGGGNGDDSSSTTTAVDGNEPVSTSEVGFIDYEDDDDDEDSDGEGGDRRRVRRPVKARSLKSLM